MLGQQKAFPTKADDLIMRCLIVVRPKVGNEKRGLGRIADARKRNPTRHLRHEMGNRWGRGTLENTLSNGGARLVLRRT
jgi:hypothetical protein